MEPVTDALRAPAGMLKAIAHPRRLSILELLRHGEQCVCHLEAALGLRQASISQQLMILREAGVVRVRREGLNIFYHVVDPQVFRLLDAAYTASGTPRPRLRRKAGATACPCPKCRSEKEARHG